jgi:hypothetical protein
MPYEYYNILYHSLRDQLEADEESDVPDVFGALLTLTSDIMHNISQGDQQRILDAYIKALRHNVTHEKSARAYKSRYLSLLLDTPENSETAAKERVEKRLLRGEFYG